MYLLHRYYSALSSSNQYYLPRPDNTTATNLVAAVGQAYQPQPGSSEDKALYQVPCADSDSAHHTHCHCDSQSILLSHCHALFTRLQSQHECQLDHPQDTTCNSHQRQSTSLPVYSSNSCYHTVHYVASHHITLHCIALHCIVLFHSSRRLLQAFKVCIGMN